MKTANKAVPAITCPGKRLFMPNSFITHVPGKEGADNFNQHATPPAIKFYAVEGCSASVWSICEFCVNNGCTKHITAAGIKLHEARWCENTHSSDEFTNDGKVVKVKCTEDKCKHTRFSCDCPYEHLTNQIYYCIDCLSDRKNTGSIHGNCCVKSSPTDVCVGYANVRGCGYRTAPGRKLCDPCALSFDVCVCGREHVANKIPISTRRILESYFKLSYNFKSDFSYSIHLYVYRAYDDISYAEARTLSEGKTMGMGRSCGRLFSKEDAVDPIKIMRGGMINDAEEAAKGIDFGPDNYKSSIIKYGHGDDDADRNSTCYRKRRPFGEDLEAVTMAILDMAKYYPHFVYILSSFTNKEIKYAQHILLDPNYVAQVCNKRFPFYKLKKFPEIIKYMVVGFGKELLAKFVAKNIEKVSSKPVGYVSNPTAKRLFGVISSVLPKSPLGDKDAGECVLSEVMHTAICDALVSVMTWIETERPNIISDSLVFLLTYMAENIVMESCASGSPERVKSIAGVLSNVCNDALLRYGIRGGVATLDTVELSNRILLSRMYKVEKSYWYTTFSEFVKAAPDFPWGYKHLQIMIDLESNSSYGTVLWNVNKKVGKLDVGRVFGMIATHFGLSVSIAEGNAANVAANVAANTAANNKITKKSFDKKQKDALKGMLSPVITGVIDKFMKNTGLMGHECTSRTMTMRAGDFPHRCKQCDINTDFYKYVEMYKLLTGKLPAEFANYWEKPTIPPTKLRNLLMLGFKPTEYILTRLARWYADERRIKYRDYGNVDADDSAVSYYATNGTINWWCINVLNVLSEYKPEEDDEYAKYHNYFFECWNEDFRNKLDNIMIKYDFRNHDAVDGQSGSKSKPVYIITDAETAEPDPMFDGFIAELDTMMPRYAKFIVQNQR